MWQSTLEYIAVVLFNIGLLIVLPLVSLFIGLWVISWTIDLVMHLALWYSWMRRGRFVLVVTSDSPIWRDYFQERIIPRLEHRAVVLNWSQRKQWKRSLAVRAFHHFGGCKEFNPMVVVIQPFRRTRVFRFYQPFRDYKHGKPIAVERLERELFELVDRLPSRSQV